MRRLPTLAFMILISTLARAAEPMLEKADLFEPGMNGIAHYRIPGIVLTTKGTLLVYCEARKNDRRDYGEIEVHLRRSTDGGRSWEPARRIAHLGERIEGNPRKASGGEREQTVNNPVAIVDRRTGNIEFLYCVNYTRCFSMRSTDDGLTFSKPVEITATFEPFRARYPWKVIATGPGHGIQLASGRLVVPVWLAFGEAGEHAPSASGTIFSDDHGRTWQAGDIVVPSGGTFGNPSESALAQLPDGRVLMVTRSVTEASRKLVSTSPDGARNWTAPRFHPELWEPICMAGLTVYPKAAGTLIFSNPHSLQRDEAGREVPGGRGRRENVSIKLSRDSGATWPVNRTLEAGPSAYSDLTVLPDGTIVCFYERDTRLSVARFNLEWLEGRGEASGAAPRPDAAQAAGQAGDSAARPSRARPNILLIVSEDNSPQLGSYGDRYARTPHLDRLAAAGVRFSRAFVTQAGCSQSRASIHTGIYPHQHGQIGLATWGYRMYREDTPNLPRGLKEAGYRTGIVGKLHVNPESAFPFDMAEIPTGNFARRNLGDYAKHAENFFRAGDAPFFLSVNYPDTHIPWLRQVDGLPAQPLAASDVEPLPYFGIDTPKLREHVANYYNCMSRLDSLVGDLLSALQRSGKADNTLIVYMSDHGADFLRGKRTSYEGGLRIPLIIRWPGRVKPGSVRDELVSGIDLMPTLLAAAQARPVAGLPGRSLQPLLFGKSAEWRRHLFTEYHTHAAQENFYPQRAVRNDRYKLIENLMPGETNPGYDFTNRHLDAGIPEAIEAAPPDIRAVYRRLQRPPRYELYDLEADPYEFRDLAGSAEHAKILAGLQQQLAAWRKETRDPLLDEDNLRRLKAEVESVSKKPGRAYDWKYPGYFFSPGAAAAPEPRTGKPARPKKKAP